MSPTRRIVIGIAPLLSLLIPFFLYQSCKTGGTDSGIKDTIADNPSFSRIQLRMVGNEKTGEIYASFPLSDGAFKDGQKVDIVWDIVVSTVDVNCSALKRKQTVTIDGSKTVAEIRFKVDPNEFDSGLRPDPKGLMKVDPVALAAYKGPKLLEGCLKIPGTNLVAKSQELPDPQAGPRSFALDDRDDSNLPVNIRYGERCAQSIGYIAPFSCIDAGVTVPIYTDGVLQKSNPAKCDKPVYLPTGDTYCNTNTRVGRLTLYKDKELTEERDDGKAVYFCRHYTDVSGRSITGDPGSAGPGYPYFDDVGIIMQNEETGKSCFFQALGDNTLLGKRVPPPTETDAEWAAATSNELKAQGARPSKTFWLSPMAISNIHCVSCHDSDPFMHSPWIDQVRTEDGELMVPSIPDVPYKIIGAGLGFERWSTAYSVEPEGSKCTTCHRIGSMNTCRTWAKDAYPLHEDGVAPALSDFYVKNFKTQKFLEHPNHHWMPPPPTKESAMPAWANKLPTYKASVAKLRECCDLTRPNGTRILGYGFINKPLNETLTAADIDRLQQNGCPVSELSSVVER